MPWERRGATKYFYFGKRVDGRVRKFFVGRGTAAELAAEFLTEERAERTAARAARAAAETLGRQTAAVYAGSRLIAGAALAVEGVFQHDRGEWRRRCVLPSQGV
jgi:hypothetical protein